MAASKATPARKTPPAVKDNSHLLTIEVEHPNGDGETVTATLHFQSLTLVPLGILRKTRRDYQEQMWAIFEWSLPPEDLDILDQVPSDKLDDILAEMQRVSGTAAGKS